MNPHRILLSFFAITVSLSAWAAEPYLYRYKVDSNMWQGKPLPLPDESKDIIYLGTGAKWAASKNSIEAAQYMRKRFPNTQFVVSAVWFPAPQIPEYLRKLHGLGAFYQYQKAPPQDRKTYALHGTLPENWRGDKLTWGNAVLATSIQHQAIMAFKIDNAAKLGVNNFKQVDFVWPWTGRWGYDKPSVNAFRLDLRSGDPGLNIITSDGKTRIIHFWDYFEAYRGVRFTPADLGLKSWEDFYPTTEINAASPAAPVQTKRNLTVFLVLYHYEYLKQAQRLGQQAKAVNGIHQTTVNPEDFANGVDNIYLMKLADFGTVFFEYFGSPVNARAAFYHMPTYRRAANSCGKKIGLIKELGQGGHGKPHKSPIIEFIHNYDLTSNGFDQYHNEWTEGRFAQMASTDDKEKYRHNRLLVFLGGAYGYKQARNDKSFRPQAPVVSVTLRSVNHYMDAWMWDVKSMDSFARYLADEHIDMEETFPGQLPEILKTVNSLFYTPIYTRKVDFKPVKDWLDAGGKTLVTHSFIPYSVDNGINYLLNKKRIKSVVIPPMINNLMKFPNGKGDTVIYRGEDKTYADFLALKSNVPFQKQYLIDDSFKSLQVVDSPVSGKISFDGKIIDNEPITIPQYWKWNDPKAKVLAKIGNLPLISVLKISKENRIIYLHCRLSVLPEPLRKQLTPLLSNYLKLPRVAQPSYDKPAFVHAYKLGKTNVNAVVLWDKKALAKFGLFAGYRQTGKWKTIHFGYRTPGANGSCRYNIGKPGEYQIYWMISGREKAIESTDGFIDLSLDNCLADICFIGVPGSDWDTKVKQLKKQRQMLFEDLSFKL